MIEGGLVNLVFKNAGQDPHEAQLVRIDDKTRKDVERALASDRTTGPPPVDF